MALLLLGYRKQLLTYLLGDAMLFILVLFLAGQTALGQWGQNDLMKQLTTAERLPERPGSFMNNEWPSQRAVMVGGDYVRVSTNPAGDLVGFTLSNDSANEINPRTSPSGSSRLFKFKFQERSKQNICLKITDDSGLTGRMSHDLLETTLIFLPRMVFPYLEQAEYEGRAARKVFLTTGEALYFDEVHNVILGGVLKEAPLDMSASRHHRKFAGLEYSGKGIMIRADRRAGTPEHNYDVAYNINERIKEAAIFHQGKTCYVSKNMIWENANNPDAQAYFKWSTDQDFLDRVINPLCGWGLTLEDLR